MTREQMKVEAISRMKKIGIEPVVIAQFEKYGNVFAAKGSGLVSRLLPEEEEVVQKFEKDTGCLVYHAILTKSEIGRTMEILYISKYEEDWEIERRIARRGDSVIGLYSYVRNLDEPMFSDYGPIWVLNCDGALVRVG